MEVPCFLMTHEEISEYRIRLRERTRAKEIIFDIKTNDKNFPNSRITKVFERIGKTSRLNLIAILVDLDYLRQNENDLLKYDGKKKVLKEKKDLYPEGFKSFSAVDIQENIERIKKVRKQND
jgi:hypothetical protein